MREWYYIVGNDQKGPVIDYELKAFLENGTLPASTPVWTAGMEDWVEAGQVEELTPAVPAGGGAVPPPLPPEALYNDPDVCPLCGRRGMEKAKKLYGTMVCRKCYYGFANRRQIAFVIDWVGWQGLAFFVGVVVGIFMYAAGNAPDEAQSEMAGNIIGLALLPVLFCKDCFAGHSLGKAICGVQVINRKTGRGGGLVTSFLRNLPLMIPFMPLIVGIRLCEGHRPGDGWSHSKVIWKKYANHPIFALD